MTDPWSASQNLPNSAPPHHGYYYDVVLSQEHHAISAQDHKYHIQRSIISNSSLNCVCLYCYQGFARMEDLYRHASDGGEGHSRILRENRNRDPRGFYDFFREALNLNEAHVDDWTICHTRIPNLFDPSLLMELLRNKKGHQSAIAFQDAVIMATTLRATCPLCHCSFSLHSTLKSHLKDQYTSESHKRLLSEPDGRFDTIRVIEELVNGAITDASARGLPGTGSDDPSTFYDVITGETRLCHTK